MYEYNDERLLSRIVGINPNGEITSDWGYTYTNDAQIVVQQYPEMSVAKYVHDVNLNVISIDGRGAGYYNIERESSSVILSSSDQVLSNKN